MRIIVTGSRFWRDGDRIKNVLEWYAKRENGNVTVVHGDCRGADRLADAAARSLGLQVEPYPADWRGEHDKQAGFERNIKMLATGADLVLAFKDNFDTTLESGGTEHMVKIALESLVPVVVRDSNGKVELF